MMQQCKLGSIRSANRVKTKYITMNRISLRLLLAVLLCASTLSAQSVRDRVAADPACSATNYCTYPLPTATLTPPPAGYEAIYMSHYGRHGSRWMTGSHDYSWPLEVLRHADSLGVLTPLGKDVMQRLDRFDRAAKNRYGELTPAGARQHYGIASRMATNFPSIFCDSATIDARSTIVVRCILSMDAACQALKAGNPSLRICCDASQYDMYYLNDTIAKSAIIKSRTNKSRRAALDKYISQHTDPHRFLTTLLVDQSFLHHYPSSNGREKDISAKLYTALYKSAGAVLSHDDTRLSFYDLFTPDELYDLYCAKNAEWYYLWGPSPMSDGLMPYSQTQLLGNIINTADSVIASGNRGATLRFGHDTNLLPLASLMELDDCGATIDNLDSLIDQWGISDYVPMAANIQMVFYSNSKGNVIVKVLLNEREVRLPIATRMAPYYDWNRLKEYYRRKLDSSPLDGRSIAIGQKPE